jgi:hypothetical protein
MQKVGLLVLLLLAGCKHKPAKQDMIVKFKHCQTTGSDAVKTNCDCFTPVLVKSFDAQTGKLVYTYYCDGKLN